MCGIAGVVQSGGEPIDEQLLERMSASLAHRGPDDRGIRVWPDEGPTRGTACVGLVHRRLSIIDLTSAGHQPMSCPQDRFHLVFNGEIYNYLELREELTRLGWNFITQTDTEVLLAGWATWGQDALKRFTGMFAFAMLDGHERRLTLARDPFGIKPLYWARWRQGLAFASEIPTLLPLPGLSRQAHPQRLFDYICFGVSDHGDGSMLTSVHQVPAGHFMEIPLAPDVGGTVTPRNAQRYWTLPEPSPEKVTMNEAAARVREAFLESVRLHLRSDVPVGSALSGGIDSSAIVAAIRHVAGDAVELHAFSYVADDPRVSEERWIDMAAQAAGAMVHKVRLEPGALTDELDELIRSQGEPFAGTSIFAQRKVFELARSQGVKVLLDGQGADELLGGYPAMILARVASLLRQGRFFSARRLARTAAGMPGHEGVRLRGAISLIAPDLLRRAGRKLLRRPTVPPWLSPQWFHKHDVHTLPPRLERASGARVLHAQLRRFITRESLPQLLRYEDRNSMTWSLESRVPFLTTHMAETSLSLPEEHIIDQQATTKAVFRQAMRGLVPDAILDRRDKIGFATPQASWLRQASPWIDQVLTSDRAEAIAPLRTDELRRLWAAGPAMGKDFPVYLWRCLNLVRWSELFDVAF